MLRLQRNTARKHVGYVPQDSAEPFRAEVEAKTDPIDSTAPAVRNIGGWFVDLGHPDDDARSSSEAVAQKGRNK